MKELRVITKIKNNRLVVEREKREMSQKDMAAFLGIEAYEYARFENLVIYPFDFKKNDWRELAYKIAFKLEKHPDFLWPEILREIKNNKVVKEIGSKDLQLIGFSTPGARLLGDPTQDSSVAVISKEFGLKMRQALNTLSPREQRVVEMYHGLNGE